MQTYKHKNSHEHNNISWEQIRIDARETEGQYILNEDLNLWMELKLTRKTTCVAYTKLKGAAVMQLLCQLIVIILGRHTDCISADAAIKLKGMAGDKVYTAVLR